MLNIQRAFFVKVLVLTVVFSSLPAYSQQREFKDYTEGLNIPKVVARVNGVGVPSDYVRFKFNRVMSRVEVSLSQRPDGAQAMKDMMRVEERKKAVVDLIDKEIVRELMYQQAKKNNKVADPKVVDQELAKLRKMLGKESAFEHELKLRGLTEDSLRINLGIDYLIQQLVQERIQGKVEIKDQEVAQFYKDNTDRFQRPEAYRVRHIFIPHFTREMLQGTSQEQLKAKADELSKKAEVNVKTILAELRAGADFAEMAKKFSQDNASAAKGGDLDFVYKGVFPKPIDQAVSNLKKGEISDIIKTQYGYHILQLQETKVSEQAPFEDLKESIQKHLFVKRGQENLQIYVDDLRKEADVEMLY